MLLNWILQLKILKMESKRIYSRKILHFISIGAEIIINYKNNSAEIYKYLKKREILINFNIPFNLAVELSKCEAITLDSGNDFDCTEVYRIDNDVIRKKRNKVIVEIYNVFRRYDVAYLPLTKADFT